MPKPAWVQPTRTYRALAETHMDQHKAKSLSLEERMEAFLTLVEAQDGGMAVADSRKMVAALFGVTEEQVQKLEREGLDGIWPPLG